MATTNKRIKIGELGFDGIKDNLKDYLKAQTQFQDYNFEGSGLSVLLDVLAYNTHYNALYTNLAVNEMFLDSASKRNSVVSIAKMLGYLPRSSRAAQATVNIQITPTSVTPPPFLVLDAGTAFTTTIDSQSYILYTRESFTSALVAGKYTFTGVTLFEGTPLEYQFTFQEGARYIIPNNQVDTSLLKVSVQEGSIAGAYTVYTFSNKITSVDATTRAYFLKEVDDGLYEIYFGDDIIGYKPSNGNTVLVSYIRCNEGKVNGASVFNMQGTVANVGNVVITTTSVASGGAAPESIASIKSNAPTNYSAQNRAVTAEDYKVILPQLYSNIDAISVWGGEENDPPIYGKVFITVKPITGETLTPETKLKITNELLKSKNVVSITPEIIDAEFLRVNLTATVYYNPTITNNSASSISSLVRQAIVNFNQTQLNKFDSVLRSSTLTKVIDGAEKGIINSIISIRLTKSFVPIFNRVQTYNVSLGNPIYSETGVVGTVVSTGFTVSNDATTYYLEDNGLGFLKRFSITSTGQKIVSPGTYGTVNYQAGKIVLQSVNITSAVDNKIEFTVRPAAQDVVSVRNQLATLNEEKIVLNVIEDKVASGETTAGQYIFTKTTTIT
jgi:hypothetical protein